jgi:hypothetical protein
MTIEPLFNGQQVIAPEGAGVAGKVICVAPVGDSEFGCV